MSRNLESREIMDEITEAQFKDGTNLEIISLDEDQITLYDETDDETIEISAIQLRAAISEGVASFDYLNGILTIDSFEDIEMVEPFNYAEDEEDRKQLEDNLEGSYD